MNTLRGVFPEPPPVQRRNFIRENMQHIKRMQGFIMNDAGDHTSYKKQSKQLENNATQKTMKLIRNTKKQIHDLSKISQGDHPKIIMNNQSAPCNKTISNKYDNYSSKTAVQSLREQEQRKFREIGVQTELNNKHSYDNGTVKYATSRSPEIRVIKPPKPISKDSSDNKRRPFSPGKTSLDERNNERERNYVRENAQAQFSRTPGSLSNKNDSYMDPTRAPTTYQKGVVPKYIRDRKEELIKQTQTTDGDQRCPEGHVVLPDNERKETLRMLRQSYSELVAELNQLPVRSDTLKIRNRKIEIENQLKKLDEGIKVFTRPKVYVKIGA